MNLIDTIAEEIRNDDVDTDDQSARLERLYAEADAAGRGVLDDAFICLCGYSLHTLISFMAEREQKP